MMKHLNNDQIAGFIDKSLPQEEAREALLHINECDFCERTIKETASEFLEFEICEEAGTLMAPEDSIRERALNAVNALQQKSSLQQKNMDIGDVIIDFTKKAGERISAALWDVVDTLTLPQAVIAVRGDETQKRDDGINLQKKYGKFDISISVARVVSGNASIHVSVTDDTINDAPCMRAGLFIKGEEIDSVAIKEGKANFTEISLDNYIMKIWDRSGERIAINIAMKG